MADSRTRTISFLAHNRRYVTAEGNGGGAVTANRVEARSWETFREVTVDDATVLLIAGNGSLLADEPSTSTLATRKIGELFPPELARFTLDPIPGGDVAIRTARGPYVTADTGDAPRMRTDTSTIGAWERFTVYDHAHGAPPSMTSVPQGLVQLPRRVPSLDEAHGAWLYPAENFWAPANVFPSSHETFRRIVDGYKEHGNIAVSVVNFVGGDQWSPRFFGIDHADVITGRLDALRAAGLLNIVFLMGNEYIRSELEYDFLRVNHHARATARIVAPFADIIIPVTEFHKSLPGSLSAERRALYLAARQGTIDVGRGDVAIGAHGVSLGGIPIDDFQGLGNVASCVQGGFGTSDDDLAAFIEEDSDRMRRWVAAGRISGTHTYVAFEHSIPFVSDRWRDYQTIHQAHERGRRALAAGADLDFSGGQRK